MKKIEILSKEIESLSREIENTKKKQMEKLDGKNTITKIFKNYEWKGQKKESVNLKTEQ